MTLAGQLHPRAGQRQVAPAQTGRRNGRTVHYRVRLIRRQEDDRGGLPIINGTFDPPPTALPDCSMDIKLPARAMATTPTIIIKIAAARVKPPDVASVASSKTASGANEPKMVTSVIISETPSATPTAAILLPQKMPPIPQQTPHSKVSQTTPVPASA